MSADHAGLLSIVSGLATPQRNKAKLVMLQSFFDESGFAPGQGAYVVSACISTVERWLAFSDEWQQILNMSPRIDYFKANDAFRLKGQFVDISKEMRDEKTRALARCLGRHVDYVMSCVCLEENLLKYKSKMLINGKGDPYYLCFTDAFQTLWKC